MGSSHLLPQPADDIEAELGLLEWFHSGDYAKVRRVVDELERLGIGRLRTGISWCDYESRPRGKRWIADLFGAFRSAGIELLPDFTYTPPGLAERASTASAPRDLGGYGRFVEEMIERFGDGFGAVELWNEPNNYCEWSREVDPHWEKFAAMVIPAAEIARSAGKLVVLGGMAPIEELFALHLKKLGVLDAVDVVGVHGFPGTWEATWVERDGVATLGGFEHRWDGWSAELAKVRAATDKPVWITEVGYSTFERDPAGQIPVFEDALAADVDRVYWYSLENLAPEHRSTKDIVLGQYDDHEYWMGMGAPLRAHIESRRPRHREELLAA
jgi:CDP-paratose 2-epimerase